MISSRSSGFTLTNTFKRIMACLFVGFKIFGGRFVGLGKGLLYLRM